MEKIVNVPGATKHFTRANHERKWLIVDAAGQSVGRLSTVVASLLRGKHKPTFTRHDDVGDFVVIVNADKVEFRGNDKASKKTYYRHTRWFGHLKERRADVMLDKNPELVIKKSVYGMIPHGALGNRIIKKLKVYSGPDHPHKAQQPEKYEI